MKAVYSLLLISFAIYCKSQVVTWGGCPNTTPKQSFNPKKMSGSWKVVAQIPLLFENSPKCTRHYYLMDSNNLKALVKYQNPTDTTMKYPMNGTYTQGSSVGEINVGLGAVQVKYQILDTDYKNYACLYTCIPTLFFFNTATAHILSRKWADAASARTQCETLFSQYNIPITNLATVPQSDCPKYWF